MSKIQQLEDKVEALTRRVEALEGGGSITPPTAFAVREGLRDMGPPKIERDGVTWTDMDGAGRLPDVDVSAMARDAFKVPPELLGKQDPPPIVFVDSNGIEWDAYITEVHTPSGAVEIEQDDNGDIVKAPMVNLMYDNSVPGTDSLTEVTSVPYSLESGPFTYHFKKPEPTLGVDPEIDFQVTRGRVRYVDGLGNMHMGLITKRYGEGVVNVKYGDSEELAIKVPHKTATHPDGVGPCWFATNEDIGTRFQLT